MASHTTSDPGPPGQTRNYPEASETGTIPFEYPKTGLKGETAYWLWGDLSSEKPPLIVLHGGPGIPHDYLLPLALIFVDYGHPVLFYDQIGCGGSTRYRDKKGDGDFWTPDLFLAELDHVRHYLKIERYNVIGHSWGAILGTEHALRQPTGLQKLVLADGLPAMHLWATATNRLRSMLPQDVQNVLDRCEREGKTGSPEYEEAMMQFYTRYVCRLKDWPKELLQSFGALAADNTVYETMNGPNEFTPIGTLKDWNVIPSLHQITSQTCPGGVLLLNSRYDEAQDEVVAPFFLNIQARIKWVTFGLSSHTPHLEETERYVAIVGSFLA